MLRPIHAGISVPDLETAIRWYSDVLGFTVISNSFADMLNAHIAFMELDGFQIELFEYVGVDKMPLPPERLDPDSDLKTCGMKHIAYTVDDFERFVKMLKLKDVDFAKEPFEMPGGPVCFIRDNAGTLIEILG